MRKKDGVEYIFLHTKILQTIVSIKRDQSPPNSGLFLCVDVLTHLGINAELLELAHSTGLGVVGAFIDGKIRVISLPKNMP